MNRTFEFTFTHDRAPRLSDFEAGWKFLRLGFVLGSCERILGLAIGAAQEREFRGIYLENYIRPL